MLKCAGPELLHRSLFHLIITASWLLSAAGAAATPIFNDSLVIDGASFCSAACGAGGDSPTPTSSSILERSFPWSAAASASSGVGSLGTSTSASRVDGVFGGYASARAVPFFTLDELVLAKLPGYDFLPDTVTVGFELALDYSNSTTAFAGANDLIVMGGINTVATTLGTFASSTSTTLTGARNLAVGSPFFFHVRLDVDTTVSGFFAASELATVRLDADPFAVFTLPEGYTVNGASGLVTNNAFQSGQPVPAPSTMSLLSATVLGLTGLRGRDRYRRRKRHGRASLASPGIPILPDKAVGSEDVRTDPSASHRIPFAAPASAESPTLRYRTLLFDLDHTLFDTAACEAESFEHALRAAGIDEPRRHLRTYVEINESLWTAVEKGDLTPQEVRVTRFERLLAAIGLDADPEPVADAFALGLGANGELFPGAREVLERLAEQASLGLITNGLSDVQRARVERLDLERYFDAIVISAEVGVAKPAREIFDAAFLALGLPAKETALMVGDSLTSDIRGGADYGIATCWYNPYGRAAGPGVPIRHEIARLEELLAIASGSWNP